MNIQIKPHNSLSKNDVLKMAYRYARLFISFLAGSIIGLIITKLILGIQVLTIPFISTWVPISVLLWAMYYFGVFGWALSNLKEYSSKSILFWMTICLFAGLILFYTIPFHIPVHFERAAAYQKLLLVPAMTVLFGSILFLLSTWLVTRPAKFERRDAQVSRWAWGFYAAIMISIWIVYLLAYYPGVMSPDSLDQWSQMTRGVYSDWHPIFHTLTNWLITRIWFSPAAIALVQIICLAVVLGWGFSTIEAMGARRQVLSILAAFAGFTPGNGMMVITLWKDVLFSVGVLALTIAVLAIVNTRGEWLRRSGKVVFLGLICASILLYRHNGYIVVAFVMALLLCSYWLVWKQLTAALLIGVAIVIGIRFGLYRTLTIQSYQHAPTTISALNVIAAHFENNTPMTQEELLFIDKIMPPLQNERVWPYNCYSNDDLFFRDRLNFNFILTHEVEIWQLAGRLTARSVHPTLQYFGCNTAFMFQISRPPHSPYEFGVNTIFPNEFGLRMISLAPRLQETMNKLIANDALVWLLGRTAFWFYLSIFILAIWCQRHHHYLYFLVLAPSFFASIPMAFLGGWQAFRYVYPSYLAGILMLGLIFIDSRELTGASLENRRPMNEYDGSQGLPPSTQPIR